MTVRRWRAAMAALGVLLGLAAGCGDRSTAVTAAPEPVHIVATYYALADLARQVGGELVNVDWVLEDGQSGDVELTDELRQRLLAADLVIAAGYCDGWAVGGYEDPSRAQRMIRIDFLPTKSPLPPAGYPWLDPDMAKALARELADRLAVRRPAYEGVFRQNCAIFCQRIDQAVQSHRPTLVRLPRPRVIAMSDALVPLARRFDIDLTPVFDDVPHVIGRKEMHSIQLAAQAGEQEQGEQSGAEGGATDGSKDRGDLPLDAFTRMYAQAASGNNEPAAAPRPAACALLVDVSMPSEVVRQLGEGLNLPVFRVDALGSSAAGGGQGSFLEILNYDLEQLSHAVAPEAPTTLPTIQVGPRATK